MPIDNGDFKIGDGLVVDQYKQLSVLSLSIQSIFHFSNMSALSGPVSITQFMTRVGSIIQIRFQIQFCILCLSYMFANRNNQF